MTKTENQLTEPDIGYSPDIESSSERYSLRFSGSAGVWLLDVQKKITKDHLRKVGAEKVVDIGGGHGQNIEPVESLGKPLTITGSNDECGRRIEHIKTLKTTQFITEALDNVSFDEKSYPHVISYRIVSHMIEWQSFINELCRISSNAVTIDFATKRSVNILSEIAYKVKHKEEGDTRRYNVLSEKDVDRVFIENGFEKVIRSAQFAFPMAMHRKINKPKLSELVEKIAALTGITALFGSPVIATYCRITK